MNYDTTFFIKRLLKMRLWLVYGLGIIIVSIGFFIYQRYQVNQMIVLEEFLMQQSIDIISDNVKYLDNSGNDVEYPEEMISFEKGVLQREQQKLDTFQQRKNDAYQLAYIDYIQHKRTEPKFADPLLMFEDEISRQDYIDRIDHYKQDFKQTLLQYQTDEEPLEFETASIALPNHLNLMIDLLTHPIGISTIVILSSIIYTQMLIGDSDKFHLIEVPSRKRWLIGEQLNSLSIIVVSALLILLINAVLALTIGEPLFGWHPSFFSKVVMEEVVYPKITQGLYLAVGFGVLVVLSFLSVQLFSHLLILSRQVVFSVVGLGMIIIGGVEFTSSTSILQSWWNPFYLFHWQDILLKNSTSFLLGLVGMTLSMTVLLAQLNWIIFQKRL
ncbi:hypothetical protein [Dolosigranulum pigrum]|jgi:membrane protein|nr:hypothetical protein [Dolosigranulum pigrum]QJS96453.1 hypothetical protein B5772_05860 [Dolosigranulum pigrum]QTJ44402.1 hypothetical protein FE328_01885 [Dolosigranulum pigrum]